MVSANLYVAMTSWQMERVINKNYIILLTNLIVGMNGYKLLILAKKCSKYKFDDKKFKICVSFFFKYTFKMFYLYMCYFKWRFLFSQICRNLLFKFDDVNAF